MKTAAVWLLASIFVGACGSSTSSSTNLAANGASCSAAGGGCVENAPCFGTLDETLACEPANNLGECCLPPKGPLPCKAAGGQCVLTSSSSCTNGVASVLSCGGVQNYSCCLPDSDASSVDAG